MQQGHDAGRKCGKAGTQLTCNSGASNGDSAALEITNSMPTTAEHEIVVMGRESSPLVQERFDAQCSPYNRDEKEHR